MSKALTTEGGRCQVVTWCMKVAKIHFPVLTGDKHFRQQNH